MTTDNNTNPNPGSATGSADPAQVAADKAAADAGAKPAETSAKAEETQALFDVKTPEEKAAAEKVAEEKAAKDEADKVAKMTPEEKAKYEKEKSDKAEADKKAKEEADKQAQPVKFEDLKVPEEMPVPEEIKTELTGLIGKHKLTGDQGKALTQDMIDLHVKTKQRELEQWAQMKADWKKEIENDPKLGGANLENSKKAANDIVRRFAGDPNFGGSPELLGNLSDRLILLGLGNDKSFMQFLINIEAATKNGSIAGTGGTGSADKTPVEKRLWPTMA